MAILFNRSPQMYVGYQTTTDYESRYQQAIAQCVREGILEEMLFTRRVQSLLIRDGNDYQAKIKELHEDTDQQRLKALESAGRKPAEYPFVLVTVYDPRIGQILTQHGFEKIEEQKTSVLEHILGRWWRK